MVKGLREILKLSLRGLKIENKRYDFFLPDYNILIERDGEQHYRGIDFGELDKKENLFPKM